MPGDCGRQELSRTTKYRTKIERIAKCKVRNTFTVLELLLVIAIIAVMASIVAFSVRPAEVLQSANEVKNMQYAKQIENAISGYILQHGGTLPAGLATSGEYTICKAGTASGCNLDLTVLVTEGFLSNIPSGANCESSVSSCYKINYDSAKAVLNVEADEASQPEIIFIEQHRVRFQRR